MDRADQGDLLQMLKERFGFKHPAGAFPKKDTMADIFSATINKSISLEALLIRDYPQFLAQRARTGQDRHGLPAGKAQQSPDGL